MVDYNGIEESDKDGAHVARIASVALPGRSQQGTSPDMAVGKAVHTFLNDDSYQPGDTLTYRPPRGRLVKIGKHQLAPVLS
jgi:hypothetical protein